jgi:hypothetical protein
MIRNFYRINFKNSEGKDILIEIQDADLDVDLGDTFTYIDLVGDRPALEIETFNTGEDEYSPIIGTRATIRFESTNATNFRTFTEGRDNRWFIRASYDSGTKFIFTGFLTMDDNFRPFLPVGRTVTLTATDNLGLLRGKPLSDFNNATPDYEGKERLITIIQWCLGKTGMVRTSGEIFDSLYVVNNLFEVNMDSRADSSENCPLNQTWVNLIDFLKTDHTFEDCHTVLTKILFSLQARVVQYNNSWYIFRLDEYKNDLFNYSRYTTAAATPVSGHLGQNLTKDIRERLSVVKADSVERIRRPYGQTILNIDYLFPNELPTNDAFIRGTLRGDSTTTEKRYDADSWDFFKGPPNVANDGDAYIRKLITLGGYQTERFFVFAVQPTALQYYIESTRIYCCEGDKISISVDVKHDGQVETVAGQGNYNVMQVRLYADDSTYYTLHPPETTDTLSYWEASDATWTTNNNYFKRFYDGTDDDTKWSSVGDDFENLAAIPKTGYLTICLHQTKKSNEFETHFSNLRFEYVPLVDGSYAELKGEQHWEYGDVNAYSGKYEENYFLFDAPCKSFRYAMFYKVGSDYFSTSNWLDYASYLMHNEAPGVTALGATPFLTWQVWSLWNQFRRSRRVFEFSFFGFDTANGHAGMWHKYTYIDAGLFEISDMGFLMLNMRQDWHSCQWSAKMIEIVYDQDRRGEENFEFKYIE